MLYPQKIYSMHIKQIDYEDIFNRSRCHILSEAEFIPYFYQQLIRLNLDTDNLFISRDIKRQHLILRRTLMGLMDIEQMSDKKLEYWMNISRIHNNTGIPVENYEQWSEALLKAVQKFDPDYDEHTAIAWRTYLDQAVAIIKLVY